MKYLLMVLLFVFSCTSNSQSNTPVVVDHSLDNSETELVCEDEKGETLTCYDHEDCCDGFHCIVDRSISRSKKFCIYANGDQI